MMKMWNGLKIRLLLSKINGIGITLKTILKLLRY